MKKWIIPIMLVCFLGIAMISPAEAGDTSRHRWQGIAIGAASAILLQHIFNEPAAAVQTSYYVPAPRNAYEYNTSRRPACPPGHYQASYNKAYRGPSGYWQSVWIPGHYDRGKYVGGHYERYYVVEGRHR